MDEFFAYDPLTAGTKGLVFVGENLLVYRRDGKTTLYPFYLDLPGGGPEDNETPFETFQREVKEEFGLGVDRSQIVYARKYPSKLISGKYAYFPVAKLPEKTKSRIRLGGEGIEFLLMPLAEFLERKDVMPALQERAKDYAMSC